MTSMQGPGLPDFLRERIGRSLDKRRREEWRDRDFFTEAPPPDGAVHLHTNDYLSLAVHPEIREVRCRALRACDDPTLMSGAFLDAHSPQRSFELAIADHVGSDDALLCQSGWAANLGLLQTIVEPEMPVYVDQLAHMSLWEGAQRGGGRVLPFRHNRPDHLRSRIERNGPGIVLVDSVYSTIGSVCPLADFVAVAESTNSLLVVDESHSLGTHGPRGAGLVAELDLARRVVFRTASLSKAFCARGGVIACPAGFADYFRLESREAIFSSAVHSYEALALLATLEVVQREAWRRERLFRNAATLRRELDALGFDVRCSESQIIALPAGTEYRALALRDVLASRGVIGAPFLAPATGRRHAIVRLTVRASITEGEIERAIEACAFARRALADDLDRAERARVAA